MKNVLNKPLITVYIRVNDTAKLSYTPFYHKGSILTNFLNDYRKHSNYLTKLASQNIEQKILKSKGNK